MNGKELRQRARNGENFTTSGLAKGHVQTNVVIIPKSHAFDFMLFCADLWILSISVPNSIDI